MRVITFALATTSIIQPCTVSVLEAAASTATGLRAPTVVPALSNGHDDISFSRSLRSSTQGVSMGGGLLGEGVVNKIESAVSSALVKYQPQEHVYIQFFDGFKAMFPGYMFDEALLKSSEVTKLLSSARYEDLLKNPLSVEGEADMARILAGLLSSKDKKVQDFGEEHLKILIHRWDQRNKKPTDELEELKEPYFTDFIKHNSAADVTLMKYCGRVIRGEEGSNLYYRLISMRYGGPEEFLGGMSWTFLLKRKHYTRTRKIIEGTMKAVGVNPSLRTEFLKEYESASQFMLDMRRPSRSVPEIQDDAAIEKLKEYGEHLSDLVKKMFGSGAPVDRLLL
ncbi:unnamed protein product [Hyaloperonospora brassicae]|uniref:RxLR effector candidate protein n=1 Tax=Hyaloperonospora brassicae TaxID=162125 RepID=A0AAV0TFB2_HYABA|nr:unnamed protein product [Hyaloperonospora brassicae]